MRAETRERAVGGEGREGNGALGTDGKRARRRPSARYVSCPKQELFSIRAINLDAMSQSPAVKSQIASATLYSWHSTYCAVILSLLAATADRTAHGTAARQLPGAIGRAKSDKRPRLPTVRQCPSSLALASGAELALCSGAAAVRTL